MSALVAILQGQRPLARGTGTLGDDHDRKKAL